MLKKKQLFLFGLRVIGCTLMGSIIGCFIWILAGLFCVLFLGFTEKAANLLGVAGYGILVTTGIGVIVGFYVGWKRDREDDWNRTRGR
jgi:hypothetical protein